MTTKARVVRVTEELEREIAREAEARGKSWPATATELLAEAVRMRQAPGVVFLTGPAGCRAVLAGAGLDVWEVVSTWRALGESLDALKEAYSWLTESQLRAALRYYRLFPAEIEDRLRREEAWTAERVRQELPFAAPWG